MYASCLGRGTYPHVLLQHVYYCTINDVLYCRLHYTVYVVYIGLCVYITYHTAP